MDSIVIFNGSLRLDDNPALRQAAEYGQRLICLFVYDELLCADSYGLARLGPFRAHFIAEAVADLDHQLSSMGQRLVVRQGNLVDVVTALCHSLEKPQVYIQAPACYQELKQVARLSHRVTLRLCQGHRLLPELPMELEKLPGSFTSFRKQVEARWPSIPVDEKPESLPGGPDIPSDPIIGLEQRAITDKRSIIPLVGGETAGQQRLADYMGPDGALSHYKETRNGLLNSNDSSKLSPWLAQGSLSPRRVYHCVKEYEVRNGANQSTYWLIFELLWRDFFAFTAIRKGKNFFGPAEELTLTEPFERWRNGETGQPFVDANMKELLYTGYMSNRGRQNVASFLIHELDQDWRLGAWWFEYQLIDHDPASNYGNWRYIAGSGQDPRGGRRFNIQKQAALYDPEGRYIQRWL
ncbi:Deoxyribodipyrimidine photo-lyase [Saliniradius amylolyticus]|uniref:Cryptochrome DASH n=1 Tax=Saliniradius amylolyticus TaxID=2183582 RepID=A0A2S2E5B9_9ALTE|nr:DASH family cryptochrome [Saliniradius amylolyticus]AWL12855.1 Deoxyribodipyrimidine photo-lyase [Saliniradius amylolyticus]